MKISVLINEQQKKILINESIGDELVGILKNNYKYTKKVLEESSSIFGDNFKLLLTWGAAIGGLIEPLSRFIQGNFSGLSDIELSIILTGIIAIYFQDNKKKLKKVLEIIKERGLDEIFKSAVNKTEEFNAAFVDFMMSLNIHFFSITKLMTYAFLAPLLFYIAELVSTGQIDDKSVKEITARLISSGVLTVSAVSLKNTLTKLIKRFS